MDKDGTPEPCPLSARTAYTAQESLVVEDEAGNAEAARLTQALEALLVTKGLLSPGEVEQEIGKIETPGAHLGARLVAVPGSTRPSRPAFWLMASRPRRNSA